MELTKNRAVLDWIDEQVRLTKPDQVIWIDGSEAQLEALRQEGLLSVPAGPETVRLLPPLNVSEEEIQQALAIIRRVLKTYAK